MNEPSPRAALLTRTSVAVVVLAVLALVLGRLSSFGIWDPWELTAADAARHRLAGDPAGVQTAPQVSTALVALGFRVFAVHEWSGRLPMAIAGLAALAVAFLLVARTVDRRTGLHAVIVAASTPLFLLNARHMVGAAPAVLASTLVFASAFVAVFPPAGSSDRVRVVALIVGAVSGAFAVTTSGALLGLAPPLIGVATVIVARREELARGPSMARAAAAAVTVVAIGTALMVVRAIDQNSEHYDAWIGSIPHAGTPPTFEVDLERIFHSFAPWSAVLPIAIGSLMTRALSRRDGVETSAGPFRENAAAADASPDADAQRDEAEARLGAAAVMWAATSFAAETVFESRYGSAPFLAAIGLAIIVALYLRTVERDGRGSWAAGIVTLLLALLILRDYAEFPGTPASGLALTDLTAPETFNPRTRWAIVLCAFAGLSFLGLATDRTDRFGSWREELAAPIAFLRAQWSRDPATAGWMTVVTLIAADCFGYGVLAWGSGDERPYAGLRIASEVLGAIALVGGLALIVIWIGKIASARRAFPWIATIAVLAFGFATGAFILSLPISSLVVRVGRALLFVPFGGFGAYAILRGLRFGFTRLGENALAPMMVASLAFGGYVSMGFEPELSQHFSPREVYDTYNALAQDDEPLGEYRVGGRAAAYYARGTVEEIADETAAVNFLMREGRVWLAFRADDLASVDRAYRRRTATDGHPGRHLFVADARSARVLLATNSPIVGRADENYLVGAILDVVPATMQHPVHCNFDHRVELVGYDLESPRPDTAGPGQAFAITWYWRSMAPVPAGYQIFLHVDGYGQRLNGDHEPVQGHYPVRLWDDGDIVVDRQELRVPANFPAGDYQYFIGFYSGETRLEILEGREDDVNRCIAGTLHVR
jgi:hypothetical protein